jgi:hypothetical protein
MTDYGPFGGPGGGAFDDATIVNMDQLEIREIVIRHGALIDSIEFVYHNRVTDALVSSDHHGGTGGAEDRIILNPGEYIVEVRGRTGNLVNSLTLQTNQNRTIGRYGGLGGDPDYDAPSQQEQVASNEVFAFFGSSGQFLDAIGIHTRTR